MKIILLSLVIGVIAGIVDIIPMVMQGLNKRAVISAFLQYVFVSIIIVNIDLFGIVWWLQGSVISLALAIPIVIIVSNTDKKSTPIILTMSVILGAIIGIAAHYLK